MKKKGFTRIFASYLMAAVIAGQTLANCAPLTVYASEKPTEKQLENKKAISQPITAYASKEPTEKEEVVYAILDSSGKVEKIEVVNSFCAQDIVDYGNYTTIKNLTTTDSIEQDGDRITCHTDAEKFYYQGSMENGELPWDIAISYKLDGKECSADELAGKDGALEIQIKVTQNKDCDESFWNGYALQASLTLDTALCKNIEANGATIANVGSDKQLSYIILPGQGADLSIKADVHDFEMEAVSINGMRLSMDFDFNTGELTDKIKEVQDAIKSLNDGSGELSDGTKTLQSGAKELYDGSVSVNDGATTLNDGDRKSVV